MKKIVDWMIFDVGAGIYFRFIFDDFTWNYSDFVIKDFHVHHDCEGFSDELCLLSYVLSGQKLYTVDEFKNLIEKAGYDLMPR